MKLCKLFGIQKKLDEQIIKEHGLEDQKLLFKKFLALRVELGELANETRCFKYWSYKEPAPVKKILEEFVDCIHFLLSIAIDIDFPIEKYDFTPYIQDQQDLVSQFNACFYTIYAAEERFSNFNVKYMFENFLGLGKMLGFSYEDIENAYLEKNKINFERLANHY